MRVIRQIVREAMSPASGKVKTDKYSWGTMKTVHHGAHFSIPLHPEHHQAIAKLKDQQEHKFKDETGRHWTAKRDGDKVHFHGANDGGKTSVPHSDLKEEVQVNEETVKHRIGLTVTDPNHPMVSKRKETIQKTIRVAGEDREKAINTAIAHYKRKGYKVHDHNYIGQIKEEQASHFDVGMLSEKVKTTHEDPLVTVHDKDGLHTHANLSTANRIFNTKVKHSDVHNGTVKVKDGWETKKDLKFAISKHHASALKEELDDIDESAWGQDKKTNLRAALDRHTEKAVAANKAGDHEAVKVHQSKMNMIKNQMSKLAKEEVEQVDENQEVQITIGESTMTINFKDWQKTLQEGLKGNQHKLDKNKNGKLDSHDFKLLRKEEEEAECDDKDEKEDKKEMKEACGKKTFREFVESINEMEIGKGGRYVHKGTYGTSYQGDDDDEDDDKPKKKPAPTGEKRGRGRPAGRTSGARQKGTGSSKSYGGLPIHSLNLPNSNK